MNLLFYKHVLDEHIDKVKKYYQDNQEINIVSLVSADRVREDLNMYRPAVICIDYHIAIEKRFILCKTIRSIDENIYIVINIPDFMGEKVLQPILSQKYCDLLVSMSVTVVEFDSVLRFIQRNKETETKREEYLNNYNEIIDEYNDYKNILSQKDNEIEKLKKDINSIIIVDPLTGVHNERYFMVQAKIALEESKRFKDNVCFLNVDIDNKLQIEELYGKAGIEFIFKETSELLLKNIRNNDYVAIKDDHSYFMILYKKVKVESVRLVAKRLKSVLDEYLFLYLEKQIRITVSIGLASSINHFNQTYEYESLIAQSKIALDNAIKKGKNQVVAYA